MEVKRVSKGLFLGGYITSIVLFVILYLGGYSALAIGAVKVSEGTDEATGQMLAGIGGVVCVSSSIFYIIAIIIISVLCYKMWTAIQDGQVRTTPGKAVGFMFIPFYNLYWLFQAIWGWSQDYNNYIETKSIQTKKMPEKFFLTLCILCVCGIVPCINFLTILPAFIMSIITINHICNGINALADASQNLPDSDFDQPTE